MLNDTYKLLASVAVARELYDADKNLYDVLAEFINEIIVRKNYHSFKVDDITDNLNNEYSFKLSDSIVKTSLRRMGFKRNGDIYLCVETEKSGSNIPKQIGDTLSNNTRLFDKLFTFLGKQLERDVLTQEEETIRRAFCDFLLQDSLGITDAYTHFFHEFILSIEDDRSLMEVIETVKEGTLLYEGMRYSSNMAETGSWNSKLCLVLDTEMLFALGGYNSSLLQSMFLELMAFIKEINRGSTINTPKIKMSYFSETKNEIDWYFDRAERIVKGLDILDPTKEAMSQIVSRCKTPGDVQSERTLFFSRLRENGVGLIERDFYEKDNPDNSFYNLEDLHICEKYSVLWGDSKDKVFESLACLSHINILRKGKSDCGFERIGYIFLTATNRTLRLARAEELLVEGDVPLATSLDFLINHFWFKLNKGFGTNKTPRTLDMVMRARCILSSMISNKASEKYDEYKAKYEREEITKEEFCELNTNLRSKLRAPNEISTDTVEEDLAEIERWNVEEVLKKQREKDFELRKANERIDQLSEQMEKKENERRNLEAEYYRIKEELAKREQQYEEEKKQLTENTKIEEQRIKRHEKEIADLSEHVGKLEAERNKREAQKNKRVAIWRKVYQITIVLALVFGIVMYAAAAAQDVVWARAVGAIISVLSLICGAFSIVKKKTIIKPET